MYEQVRHMKIQELLHDNYVYAYVLYYFGIEFFEEQDKTLEEVCRARNLKVNKLLSSFGRLSANDLQSKIELEKYPIELVTEYLKHSHHIFIKQKLPYLAFLIDKVKPTPETQQVLKELKDSFPMFTEDFIRHIYQEEDTIFAHIQYLRKAKAREDHLYNLFCRLQNMDLTEMAIEHEAQEDDEMSDIRDVTYHYKLSGNIAYDVLMKELRAFDGELALHCRIENEIFFPKAMMLEAEVKAMVQEKSLLN